MTTPSSGDVRTRCVADYGRALATDGEHLFFQDRRKDYFRLVGDDPQPVSKSDYFDVVFEGHYTRAFLGLARTDFDIAVGPDRIYASYVQASILEVYDFDRTLLHEWEDFFDWYPVYDIALEDGEHLWYSASTRHYVGKKRLSSQEEVFGIGGTWDDEGGPFDYPEGLFIADGFLYVADMGNHRVCRLDLSTYALDTGYRIFDEGWSVWEYCRVGEREFVVLQPKVQEGGGPERVHEIVNTSM